MKKNAIDAYIGLKEKIRVGVLRFWKSNHGWI